MFRSVLRFAPTAALFALTVATGHLAATYVAGFMLGRYVHRASADLAKLAASF